MTITFRQAVTDDFDKVFELIREFARFIQTPEKVVTTPAQMREDKDFFRCIVALDGDTIVGFATWFFGYYSWSGKAVYLDDLYVTENYRGQQIGSRLLDEVIVIAKAENCRKVRWQVSKWNDNAIEFYKKKGAIVDDVEINCDLWL